MAIDEGIVELSLLIRCDNWRKTFLNNSFHNVYAFLFRKLILVTNIGNIHRDYICLLKSKVLIYYKITHFDLLTRVCLEEPLVTGKLEET